MIQNIINQTITTMSNVIDMSTHGEAVCITFQDFESMVITPDNYGTYTCELNTRYGTQVLKGMTIDTVITFITNHHMLATI